MKKTVYVAQVGCANGSGARVLSRKARQARGLMFRLLAKALGEKAGKSDEEADKVAWIRAIILAQAVATNLFIVAGVIKHWS